jgi:hypothetical protein
MRWWDEAESTWRSGRGRKVKAVAVRPGLLRTTKVTLATAHLDHDPTNNHPRNLKALCQRRLDYASAEEQKLDTGSNHKDHQQDEKDTAQAHSPHHATHHVVHLDLAPYY